MELGMKFKQECESGPLLFGWITCTHPPDQKRIMKTHIPWTIPDSSERAYRHVSKVEIASFSNLIGAQLWPNYLFWNPTFCFGGWLLVEECIKQHDCTTIRICMSISIQESNNGSPLVSVWYANRNVNGGPWQRMNTSEKKLGSGLYSAARHPAISFVPCQFSVRCPSACLSAFIRRSTVDHS